MTILTVTTDCDCLLLATYCDALLLATYSAYFSRCRQKKQRPPKPGGRSLVPMSPRGSNPTPGKPVKRSSSFDRFTRGRGSAPGATPRQEKEKEAGAAPAPQQTFSKQLLFILLSRGPNGEWS